MVALEEKYTKMAPAARWKVSHKEKDLSQALKDKYTNKVYHKKDRFGADRICL